MSNLGISVWLFNTGFLIKISKIKKLIEEFDRKKIFNAYVGCIEIDGYKIILNKGNYNYKSKQVGHIEYDKLTSEHMYLKNKNIIVESDEVLTKYINQIMEQITMKFNIQPKNIYEIINDKSEIYDSSKHKFKDTELIFIKCDTFKKSLGKLTISNIIKIIFGIIYFNYEITYYYYIYNTEQIITEELRKYENTLKKKDKQISELELKLSKLSQNL